MGNITKESAIAAVKDEYDEYQNDTFEARACRGALKYAMQRIEALPDEETSTGTWERIHEIDGKPTFSFWRCSNCHKAHFLEPPNADYCPACGARMERTEE